jgi:hypothetical protein
MFGKRLSKDQLGELRSIIKLIRSEEYKLKLVEKNTLVVPHCKDWVETQKAIIQLLTNEKENYIALCARSLGLTGSVSLDLSTGKIWTEK